MYDIIILTIDNDDDGDWWSVWVCVTFFLFILPPRWKTCNISMKMYVVDFYVFSWFFSVGFNGFRLVFMVIHNNWLFFRFLDICFFSSGLSVRSHGSGWFFMFFFMVFVWIPRYLVVFMVLSNNR